MPVRVVEVVRRVAKGVDLELGQQVLGQLLQEPVENQAAFNGALGVQDEDDAGVLRAVQRLLDDAVGEADVGRGVAEVALDQALDDVEDYAGAMGC